MKILHINDMAGVAGCLVKYLRKAGHQADLISFMDDHEFGFCEFYKGKHFQDQDIMRHVLAGVIPQYDIIHLHFSYQLLEWLYKFDKPIVYHAHGTEIATETMDIRIAAQKAEGVLVSGEQLVQYHPRAQYLPNPVDTEHFKPDKAKQIGSPFTFQIDYLDIDKLRKVDYQVSPTNNLVIYDRKLHVVPYAEMPERINRHTAYIDYRYHRQRGYLSDMSLTGLQALACGLKVYHDGQWKEGLPEQHKPENVVQQLVEYYEGILN